MSGLAAQHGFFGWSGIGAMPDGSHHGEGEHDQRHMPVPAMPGTGLVVIEAEFVLGGFKAFFDGPAMAFDRYELFHWHALGAPRREERKVAVGNVAADQKASRPRPGENAVILAGIEIGQFEIDPMGRWIATGTLAE